MSSTADRVITALGDRVAALEQQGDFPSTSLIKATSSSGDSIELDAGSGMFAMYFQVTFALRFPNVWATGQDLSTAFAKILPSFEPLAGRLATQQDGKLVFLCNNAGVPLTMDKRAGNAPSFANPIPEDLFDMVQNAMPASDEAGVTGDAPLRIKVTDFDDGQVIALCVNHGLCDAGGMGLWMSAWAEAFRGGDGKRSVSHDRVGQQVPSPVFGSPPLSKTDGVPAEWQALRLTKGATCPNLTPAPLESPMFASVKWSAEQCASLKAASIDRLKADKSAQAFKGVTFVSTNDAITAALATAISPTFEGDPEFEAKSKSKAGENAATMPVSMIADIREAVGAGSPSPVFGNMFTAVEMLVHPTSHAAAALHARKALSVAMDGEFFRWSIGQGHNMGFAARLAMNSWCKGEE
jgi:hypothetical protein